MSAQEKLLYKRILQALYRARDKHPEQYVDLHHMYGVLAEELQELLEAIRKYGDSLDTQHKQIISDEILDCLAVLARGLLDLDLLMDRESIGEKVKRLLADDYIIPEEIL